MIGGSHWHLFIIGHVHPDFASASLRLQSESHEPVVGGAVQLGPGEELPYAGDSQLFGRCVDPASGTLYMNPLGRASAASRLV